MKYLESVSSSDSTQYSSSLSVYVKVATMTFAGKKLTNIRKVEIDTTRNTITVVLPNDLAPNRHMIRLIAMTKVE